LSYFCLFLAIIFRYQVHSSATYLMGAADQTILYQSFTACRWVAVWLLQNDNNNKKQFLGLPFG